MLMPLIMIYKPSDYYISLNNIYASLIMASSMILLMPVSKIILLINILILVLSILAIRNQWFVNDNAFLRDMIPHHSMALLTSSHIVNKTKNSDLKNLATTIYNSQTKEIEYMKGLI
jgi:hypothetical protein